MATWSPEKARCDYPEEEELLSPTSTSGKSIMTPSYRGRRVPSRVRVNSVAAGDETGGESSGWAEGFLTGEGSTAEGSVGGGGSGVGRGRGRGRKVEVKWVQCDGCQRWRKLTGGVRSEDLPDKW